MKTVVIRPAGAEDIDDICRIAVMAWQGIHDGYRKYIDNNDLYDRLNCGWQTEKARQVREKVKRSPGEVLVSEVDGKIVGFTTFTLKLETGIGEIGNNAVEPDCQGMGIGSAQHNKVLEIFRQHRMKYAIVGTGYEDEGHAKARASYEKVGFKKLTTSVTYSLKL